jgi:ribosomal protein S18 acetylase RimI-like enzyme
MPVIDIRRATPDDVGALLELMEDFYAESGFALDHQTTAPALQTLLDSPSLGCIWLACLDGTAVGHAVFTVRFAMEHEGLSGCIDDLYVMPRFRRKGVARALLAALVAECRERSCKAFQVEVTPDNAAALALYAGLGLYPVTDGRVLARGPLPPPESAPREA